MAAEACYDSYDPGWKAPPFDARYPHQNQYTHCLRSYIDYDRCLKIKGEDYVDCNYFKKVYKRLCTRSMIEKWDEQKELGTFPYKL